MTNAMFLQGQGALIRTTMMSFPEGSNRMLDRLSVLIYLPNQPFCLLSGKEK